MSGEPLPVKPQAEPRTGNQPAWGDDPLGDAIWEAIKRWDLEREPGAGYAGSTGTDVLTIIAAVRPLLDAAVERAERAERELRESAME